MKGPFALLLLSLTASMAQDGQLWKNECVQRHNYYRKQQNKPLMKWDKFAAHYARERAEYLRSTCSFNVSSTLPYGENLRGAPTKSCSKIVDVWHNYKKKFNPKDPQADKEAMAYAQLMWKTTTLVGCAYSKHCEYKFIVVCYYYPPGNLRGSTTNQTINIYKQHV